MLIKLEAVAGRLNASEEVLSTCHPAIFEIVSHRFRAYAATKVDIGWRMLIV